MKKAMKVNDLIIEWARKWSLVLIVSMSFVHILLAYMHTQDSGTHDRLVGGSCFVAVS